MLTHKVNGVIVKAEGAVEIDTRGATAVAEAPAPAVGTGRPGYNRYGNGNGNRNGGNNFGRSGRPGSYPLREETADVVKANILPYLPENFQTALAEGEVTFKPRSAHDRGGRDTIQNLAQIVEAGGSICLFDTPMQGVVLEGPNADMVKHSLRVVLSTFIPDNEQRSAAQRAATQQRNAEYHANFQKEDVALGAKLETRNVPNPVTNLYTNAKPAGWEIKHDGMVFYLDITVSPDIGTWQDRPMSAAQMASQAKRAADREMRVANRQAIVETVASEDLEAGGYSY